MLAQPVYVSFILAILLAWPVVRAEEAKPELESSMGLMMADKEKAGYAIVPAADIAISGYTEDLAPPQVFEIIRPGMGPVSVGRLMSSCGCLLVTMEKKEYAQGERAVILVRNVKPTVKDGATYAFFVQLEKPVKDALQYDIFVKSGPWEGGAVALGGHNPIREQPRPTPPPISPPVPDRPHINPPVARPPAIRTPRPQAPDYGISHSGRDNTGSGPGFSREEIVPEG